jgi:hypothetical protein
MRIRIRIEPFKFIAANFCSFVKIYKNMQQYFFQSFPKIKASQIEPKVYFDISLNGIHLVCSRLYSRVIFKKG